MKLGWLPRRRQPEPPQNVRVVMRDGRELPVECVYDGEHDGTHRWVAVWTLPERPAGVRVDALPGRTSIVIGVRRKPS